MAETSRQINFLVVLSCIVFVSVNGECSSGTFGEACQYKCHCAGSSCDPTSGQCSDGCLRGWSGPSCQKQNIALGRSVSQSSEFCKAGRCFRGNNAVDGSTNQDLNADAGCFSTNASSFNQWRVSFQKEHYIHSLKIYNRADCCSQDLSGFRVEVGQADGTDANCFTDPGDPLGLEITIHCKTPVRGTSVAVILSGVSDVKLALCEVEVYVCSKGWYGEECENQCTGPNCQQCDSTGTTCDTCKQGHFGLDCLGECHCYGALCKPADGICSLKGKKRCAKGWMGSTCSKACPDNKFGVDCMKTCGNCWNDAICSRVNGSCPTSGKHICEPGYNKQRCLKGCTSGKWGADCMNQCGHCAAGRTCHPVTGECENGNCEEGWDGIHCDVDKSKVCPDGKFGLTCENDCGQCFGSKACNKTTGDCPAGNPLCQPGNSGSQCLNKCGAGFYGADCVNKCGNCYNDETCDPIAGACPNQATSMRCQPGWSGVMCTTNCSTGYYGVDCSSQCSQKCMVKEPCNPVTGACIFIPGQPRCEPGFRGDNCKEDCDSGTYGADCIAKCGNCHMGSCDNINGTCYKSSSTPRCQAGFHGLQCLTACKNGTYGADCQSYCHCKSKRACDATGWCPEEDNGLIICEPGWMGARCNTECSENLYGEGCRSTCGHCRDLAVCNVRTGACPHTMAEVSVCQDGWTGERCDTEERSDITVLVACICVTFLVVLIAGGIIFVALRRRNLAKANRRQENGDDPQQLFNLLSPEERNGSATKSELKGNKKRFLLGKATDETGKIPIITTRSVEVSDLLSLINSQRAVEDIKKEHEQLPKGLTASTSEASKPENKPKNRFQGIVAYDHSRVVLNLKDAVPCSDYINACFAHGYKEQYRYIASQGPTANILEDFWRMIWQFDCTRIIMLTNLVEDARRKCDLYWPTDEDKTFGDICVSLLETEAYADFTIRTFNVSNVQDGSAPSRIVKQFHFTAWPDHGVPHYPTALVHFREKVHTTNTTGTGPLVVHCSAGIGRTGTFIGLDYLIDQAKAEGKVDVLMCVLNMRKQRVNMIQTEEQYAFLYEALTEAVLLSDMSIEASKFEEKYRQLKIEDSDSHKTGLQEQFEMLASMSPIQTEKECAGACLPQNSHRNRDTSILAADHWRPFLITQWPDTTDYINAVFLPAYRDNLAFIATQMPLPHTTVDMWRLIHNQKSHCVIMLNDLEAVEDEKSVYWPYDNTTEGMFGPFKVQVVGVEKKSRYDIQTMTMVYTRMPDKEPLKLKQFVVKFWPDGKDVPADPADLLMLMDDVERWRQQSGPGPVIVHCMNGAEKCGLYCAVSGVIERLKLDQEVNILQTIKQMRINRPQVIKDMTQYQFCFDAVVAFLDSFQTYSNFK